MSTSMESPKEDPFSFPIQLNTRVEERGFHRYNDGDEIQRADILDDCCQGLLLMGRIDRIVHGRKTEGGDPATLIVFGFRLHGLNEKRRFKEAIISVTFQDEKKRERWDPEVIGLWPDGDFTLGEPTPVQVEGLDSAAVGSNLEGGAMGAKAGGHFVRKWESKQSYNRTERSKLIGSIVLDMDIRQHGKNNGVRLTLREDPRAASGLVTDLCAAVLLRRRDDEHRFTATVGIKAKAHFSYNTIRGMRDICGFAPGNDPVIFQPGVQYLRPPSSGNPLREKLREYVDEDNLNVAKLDEFAGVLGSTSLSI